MSLLQTKSVNELKYSASSSRQFHTGAVTQSTRPIPASRTSSSVTTALSLTAGDADQLGCDLARLLLSPPIQRASTTTTTDVGPRSQRQRRRVDRGASEDPLSSSLAAAEPAAALGRYKTELCRPYEEHGACKYGDKCQFAHGRAELRPVARHPKYKTDLCKTYHTTGLCPYGPRCHFIHNDDERQLNEFNRLVIEQQRALLAQQKRKQVLVQTALEAARCQQLAEAVVAAAGAVAGRQTTASRSPSPSLLSGLGDEPPKTVSARTCFSDEATWTTECAPAAASLAELDRRVRQAAPRLTDAEVQQVVSRLLVGAFLSDTNISYHRHLHRPHHVQLHQQHQLQKLHALQRHQRPVAQPMLNSEARLLFL